MRDKRNRFGGLIYRVISIGMLESSCLIRVVSFCVFYVVVFILGIYNSSFC